MSTVSNKDIALSIIGFLKQAVASKEVAEDYAESMDIAIDCIADAFEVNKDDDKNTIASKFGGKSLPELLKNQTISKQDEPTPIEVDEETKKKADELKVEGNRAMAAKDYPTAIAKYTEAIGLDPTNVVYLSNRAAAHSSAKNHEQAVEDAEKAIKLNPNFSKAYSRLGLAQYALGDAKASMEAYKKGLDVEGDSKSEAMKKGYETAKKRVEELLEDSIATNDRDAGSSEPASGGAGAGGLPDLSSLLGGLGGGAGGMPNFAEMMNNPAIMQAAQQMMSDPQAMQNLLNNPMLSQFMGGLGGRNNNNNQGGSD
ncbi:sgt2 [Candida pseudojiufengensis]|uniref:sgt2 n=1 Tax=Candida pseudojiufengensis TaxID=497109 RepID=UPI002225B0FC|nr:sgt2 [Candida pseudojiufengensis]KAI5958978.1 sgt2 [Candida pseudojiufengensis]